VLPPSSANDGPPAPLPTDAKEKNRLLPSFTKHLPLLLLVSKFISPAERFQLRQAPDQEQVVQEQDLETACRREAAFFCQDFLEKR
ncbi:unnamed protein product, partial [Amoebophrya sp. A25]